MRRADVVEVPLEEEALDPLAEGRGSLTGRVEPWSLDGRMKGHVAVPEAEDLEQQRRIVPYQHAVVVVDSLARLVQHEDLQEP